MEPPAVTSQPMTSPTMTSPPMTPPTVTSPVMKSPIVTSPTMKPPLLAYHFRSQSLPVTEPPLAHITSRPLTPDLVVVDLDPETLDSGAVFYGNILQRNSNPDMALNGFFGSSRKTAFEINGDSGGSSSDSKNDRFLGDMIDREVHHKLVKRQSLNASPMSEPGGRRHAAYRRRTVMERKSSMPSRNQHSLVSDQDIRKVC